MQSIKDVPITMSLGTAVIIVWAIGGTLFAWVNAWSDHETRIAIVETQITNLWNTLEWISSDVKEIRDYLIKN